MAFSRQAGLGRGVLVFTASPATGGQSALGPQVTGQPPSTARTQEVTHWQATTCTGQASHVQA